MDDTATIAPPSTPEAGLTRPLDAPVEENDAEIDYFGTADNTYEVYLPGSKKQYLICKVLKEGDRKRFQNTMNRGVRLDRGTGDAHLSMAPGDERHELLKMSIVGWTLQKEGKVVPFDPGKMMTAFLMDADPKVIDHIEKEIRKRNPWLLAEMSEEDLEKEIATLTELLETKRKENAGK